MLAQALGFVFYGFLWDSIGHYEVILALTGFYWAAQEPSSLQFRGHPSCTVPVLILTEVVVAADFPRLQYVLVGQPWAPAFALIPHFLSLPCRPAGAGSGRYPSMTEGAAADGRQEVQAHER